MKRSLFARIARAAFACVAFTAVCCLADMQPAQAKSYTCDEISIEATAERDAALAVSETRSYNFDGSFSLVAFVLDPPENGGLVVNKAAAKSISSGRETTLDLVAFKKEWRDSGGPGNGYYSVDTANNTVYCFAAYSGECSVTVEYSYTNAVLVHKDVSELCWQFVGEKMEVDSKNVNLALKLPMPEGETIVRGENVRAWGHGALDGTVTFAENGDAAVYFKVPHVKSGEFAEMRVTYPASWTSKASTAVADDEDALGSILAQEQEWADQANGRRWQARLLIIVPALLSAIMLALAFAMFFRHGREHEPDFQGDYWRDVPDKELEPAVVGRIMRWGAESPGDFTATLMRLSARGVLRMEKVTEERSRMLGLGTKTVDDYVLICNPDARYAPSDLEQRALSLVFDKVGAGANEVSFEEIKKYGKDNPESFVNAMDAWQSKVGALTNAAGAFEAEGERWSRTFKAASVVLPVAVGALCYLFIGDFMPLIAVAPCSVATFFLAGKIRRRSRRAGEVNAKAEGLKRWFKDFTNLKEAIPTDTNVWGELLVYAYLLGVAKEAISGLRTCAPQLWDDDAFVMYSYWYWMPHGETNFSNAFNTAWSNTVSTAKSALSSDSSGGGSGGGFSGGGGGGFGGGGGGFAR